ncbi:MAG: InlB B-repeat-containing protein [Clostridia bacterium]|nr:InlB B-repeat-containing protein [Clostridia bacterium]
MKKRILSLLLALVTVFYILPIGVVPAIATDSTDEETGLSVSDMEVGKLYSAKWDYSETDEFLPQKPSEEEGEEGLLEWKGYPDVSMNDAYVPMADFPQSLIVKRTSEEYLYDVYVTNEDWPAEYNDYRYVNGYDIIITGEYTPPADDGYIYGKVGIFCEDAVDGTLTLEKGEKVQAFTELDAEISENAKFQWQMKLEDDRWATITDCFYSWINISEALITNAKGENATLRCAVTDGTKKYASEELKVAMEPEINAVYAGANGAGNFVDGLKGTNTLGADSSESFQVKIAYYFAHSREKINDTQAASPFIYTFHNEDDVLNATISFPYITGYTACVIDANGDISYKPYGATEDVKYTAQSSYTFEDFQKKDSEDENGFLLKVYYVPNLVYFTVEYYEQNLADDAYSRAGQVRLQGYADEYVGPGLDVAREGFKSLYYDNEMPISGDDGTVVEIYYDRIYYLVDFDLGGGYGIMPYYVRYGTQVMLSEPTRPGYSFKDPWELAQIYEVTYDSDDNKVETPITITNDLSSAYANKNAGALITVKNNLDYKANWNAETTSYTIIYWLENADNTNFTLHSFKEVKNVAPGSIVSATDSLDLDGEEDYFTFISDASDKNVSVEGDGTTAVNAYYLRNYYTLTFSGNGSECIRTEHTHDSNCPSGNCTQEVHSHGAECGIASQTCGIEEHSHIRELVANGGCLSCTASEHFEHTSECIVCGKEEHIVHTYECYDGATNTTPSDWTYVAGDEVEGYVGRSGYRNNYTYWIYINGQWYEYENQNASSYYRTQVSAKDEIHSHDDDCYSDELHKHSETCYGCGKNVHSHTTACYTYECGKDEHTHGGDCYRECQILEHTHTDTCFSTNTSKTFQSIKCKYGADISFVWREIWEVFPNGERWDPSGSSTYTEVLVYIPFMPGENISFSKSTSNADTFYINYYLQSLGNTGTLYNGNYYDLKNTVNANYNYLTKAEDFFDIIGFTQNTSNPTFDSNGQLDINGGGDVYLYYTRNKYNLEYVSNNVTLTSLTQSMFYQQSIGAEFNVLAADVPYPTNVESGAVQFAGWYTTPTCADGTDFKFDGSVTMPIDGLILYSKWIPTEHNIKVYRQKNADGTFSDSEKLLDKTVEFGTQVFEDELASYTKPNENYVFNGWYYLDENNAEQRYDFNTMVVKQDYVIYAKWGKNVQIAYTVTYVTEDADGNMIEIGEPEGGYALAGIPKSFTAKMGDELNVGYKTWYFPTERYITRVISENKDENNFVFEYKTAESVTYTIKHIFNSNEFATYFDGATELEYVFTETITKPQSADDEDKFQATITERFDDLVTDDQIYSWLESKHNITNQSTQEKIWTIISSLTADNYVQTMDLTLDASENVMTFNWAAATTTKKYQVVHYLQNKDLSTYSVLRSQTITVENVDTLPITAEWDNPYGFVRSKCMLVIMGDDEGTEVTGAAEDEDGIIETTLGQADIIEFYYNRDWFTYTVYHYINGTATSLDGHDPETYVDGAYYEQEITVASKAHTVEGYTIANASAKHVIGSDNYEIRCFYNPMTVNYLFQAVGGGQVNPITLTGKVDVDFDPGTEYSEATPSEGYVFVGWYTDAACNNPVTDAEATVNGTRITPVKPGVDKANDYIYFYAKFIPTTRVFTNVNVAEGQAIIYRLQGKSGDSNTEDVDITFVIIGSNSVTLAMLPYGNYTVTVTDWSWRYSDLTIGFDDDTIDGTVGGTYDLTLDAVGDVTFTFGAPSNNQWLTDDANDGSVTPGS